MKNKANFLHFLIIGITAFTAILLLDSCRKCSGEQPRARLVNKGTKEADFQIVPASGSTINVKGVAPGAASGFSSFAPGKTTITIFVDKASYPRIYPMAECVEYEIVIDANGVVTSSSSDRNN